MQEGVSQSVLSPFQQISAHDMKHIRRFGRSDIALLAMASQFLYMVHQGGQGGPILVFKVFAFLWGQLPHGPKQRLHPVLAPGLPQLCPDHLLHQAMQAKALALRLHPN